MASRATRTTAAGRSKVVKPSDIHELKVKTEQIHLRIRRLKAANLRMNDQMVTRTTGGQNPGVMSSHQNAIPQLRRSVEAAQHALESLRKQIDEATVDDRVFLVKELQEEVKLAYCENQRLNIELQDRKNEAKECAERLEDASLFASGQNLQKLQREIREFQGMNKSLRDKADAYSVKKEKIEVEKTIKRNQENKVPPKQVVDEAIQRGAENRERVEQQTQELARDKERFLKNVDELQQIIDEQRRTITAFLSGNVRFEEEEEVAE